MSTMYFPKIKPYWETKVKIPTTLLPLCIIKIFKAWLFHAFYLKQYQN